MLKGKEHAIDQDIIFISLNPSQSKHWVLAIILPKQWYIKIFDSMASQFIKPITYTRIQKVGSFLCQVDPSIDVSQ